VPYNFNVRRQLKGHFGKVYALDWAGDDTTLLSASQDGKLIVWNAFTENKLDAVSLKSAWVMACCFEKEDGRFVAAGGLDNTCSLYDLRSPAAPPLELIGHDGYLADCRFLARERKYMLTCSGDATAALWDVERGGVLQARFAEHSADVMSVAPHPSDPSVFATGSCDTTVRVWDIRAGRAVQAFCGHASDVNAVAWLPEGCTLASGSDDASCRLWDLRSRGPVGVFADDRLAAGVTDVAFSSSGRLLFAGYEDSVCIAWESVAREGTYHELAGHKSRVSCLGVNASGQALATGSWDTTLLVWA